MQLAPFFKLFAGCLILVPYCLFFKKYFKNKYDGEVCTVKEKSWLQTGSVWTAALCGVFIIPTFLPFKLYPDYFYDSSMQYIVLNLGYLLNILCVVLIVLFATETRYKYGIKSFKLTVSSILGIVSGFFLDRVITIMIIDYGYYFWLYVFISVLLLLGCYVIAIICVKSAIKKHCSANNNA